MNFKNRKVMLLIFLVLYAFLVAGFIFISHQFLIVNFQELESNKNNKDINIILSSVTSKMEKVEQLTSEYSYKDYTYNFIKHHEKYTKNSKESVALQNLDVILQDLDFVIYTNSKNKIVYSKYNKRSELISDLKIFEKNLLKVAVKEDEFSSLFKVEKDLIFLRKSKILKSNKDGSFNGFIYAGKFITKHSFVGENIFVKNIKLSVSDKTPEFHDEEKIKENFYTVGISIQNHNDLYFLNTFEFYDIYNNYLFSVTAENKMEILKSGKDTVYLYNLAVSVLVFIIFFVLLHFQDTLAESNSVLEKQVKDRTKKLDEYVNIVNKYVTTSSTDLEGNITNVSEAFCRISGYSKEELIGKNHRVVKHPDMDPSIFEDLWDSISQGKKWVGEIKNKKKNGDAYWVLANIDPIYSDDGKKIGYTSIRQEITDKKRIEKLSVTDKLTQLYNRVRLEEIFTVEIAKFHRYKTHFSIILIDIDHFKEVNDTYGHNVGDSLLKEIADLLKSSVRVEDVVGRWGGEEFIILSNNYNVQGVMQLAEKIRRNIEEYNFKTVGKKTASFGVAILNTEDTQESLIYRADKSLYHAKKTGRNRVCLH